MREGTRHLWALSLNHLASINNAMKLLAGSSVNRSKQHIDLGPSRLTQYYTVSKRFKNWLTARNPFTFEDSNLHLLSAGFISIAVEDEINCDDFERIGANTQAGMDGKSFTEVRFKQNNQAKPLDWYQNRVTIDEVKVYINSTALFTRLAALAKREENEESYFYYEMSNEPMSLFKNMMTRKPDKPSLQKTLVTDEELNKLDLTSGQNNYSYVVDGGTLLHRLCWLKESNFEKRIQLPIMLSSKYERKHYGKCYIVFDGYESASTKSVEQKRKDKRFQKCPDVDVKENIIVPFTQETFISKSNNKVQLIEMLSQYLKDDENEVINCSGDADSTICHTALDLATTGEKKFVLIADDTDIFVMLIYHWKSKMKNIFQQKILKGWNIASLFPRHPYSFCSRDDRMRHNISTLWKGEGKLFNQILKSKMLQS